MQHLKHTSEEIYSCLKCKLIEKKSISKILSTILFIGCTVFVGIRGNKCFEKYLEKPEVVGVSYKFGGKIPFPSFSICTRDNDTYNDFIFEQCNMKKVDYITNGPWVGTGNEYCTNPKGKKMGVNSLKKSPYS